tara:strand:+ start:172 stop:975 length:804 start_codon:yes stop_codon:yes gene_type:complete
MRYDYTSSGFKNDFYGTDKHNKSKITAVNILIALNIVIFFLLGPKFFNSFALTNNENFRVWQLLTYMFLHDYFYYFHIAINMFVLWMFGKPLELIWGASKFLKYYFITGIGAGICIYLFSPSGSTTIGASGATSALVFAFGYLYPNRIMLFYFFPMKAKYTIFIVLLYSIYGHFFSNDNISHVGHLGGMFMAFIYLHFGNKFFNNLPFIKMRKVASSPIEKTNSIDDEQINLILDKLKDQGWDGLDEEEKAILFQASQERRKNNHLN